MLLNKEQILKTLKHIKNEKKLKNERSSKMVLQQVQLSLRNKHCLLFK